MKILAVAILVLSSVGRAEPIVVQAGGEHREFIVHAVAPEVPAMKYRLTMDPIDRQEGDAAPLYLRALLLLSKEGEAIIDRGQNLHDQGLSPKDDPKVVEFIDGGTRTFDLLALAARKEQCDWHQTLHEQGFNALLPEMNGLRREANLLQVRAWLQLERGQTAELLQTLRVFYGLGQNTGKKSVLVGGLVGVGIARLANEVVADWAQQPDAPNLYWDLVNLPRPFVSFREAMETERMAIGASMPVLLKGLHSHIVAEDWQAYLDQAADLQTLMTIDGTTPMRNNAAVVASTASLPAAKKFYADSRHISVEDVDKLDSHLLLATYFIEQYQIAADEVDKLVGLPFVEQVKAADRWKTRLDELGIDPVNVARIALPFNAKASMSFARLDRQIVALTAVHALRAYAASHGDQLPAKLEDVTETPIPVNPMTDKPFDYSLKDGTATLSDQTSPGSTGRDGKGLVYTVRLEGL